LFAGSDFAEDEFEVVDEVADNLGCRGRAQEESQKEEMMGVEEINEPGAFLTL
jgi:hypothetical protein